MRVLIIEDEAPAFRRLQKVLEEVNSEIKIIEVLDSVEETVKWFSTPTPHDLIFMDIQLSDGLSFEIFDSVKITKPIIFTTAFDEYMLRAFKVNSIDYLLKPIKKDELANSLRKYQELKRSFGDEVSVPDINSLIRQIRLDDKKYKTRFLVRKGEELISIETEAIAYFQSRNGVVYLISAQGTTFIIDFNLDELTQQMDPAKFFRANRQFLIAYDGIKKTHRYYKGKLLVEMERPTDEPITISSEKASEFKQWLGSK